MQMREHLVQSGGYWFRAAREKQATGLMAEALLCMENAYNHVENAVAVERSQREGTERKLKDENDVLRRDIATAREHVLELIELRDELRADLEKMRVGDLCSVSGSTEAEILEFVSDVWGPRELPRIALKLGEEAGEVQGAVVKLDEERATVDDLDDELGDVLIVLSQMAAKRGTTLEALRRRRFDEITRRNRK